MSPTDTSPSFGTGLSDIVTTIAGYAEMRPGFSLTVEPSPTSFINLNRLFTWNRFDGKLITMACQVNSSNQSVVYKMVSGADNSFVSVFTDTGSSNLFDFAVSNNTVYFSNGNVAKAWEPINGIRNWGIAIGSVNNASGSTIAGTGANLNDGIKIAWINPANVNSTVSFATASVPGSQATQFDQASQFGFALTGTTTIIGIQVSVVAERSVSDPSVTIIVEIMKLGVQTGNIKTANNITSSPVTYTFGGTSDLWGTTWTANDINQSTFGVGIRMTNDAATSPIFSIRNVQITVFGIGGPSVAVSGSAGSFSANIGYQYVFCYGNSNSGHISSPTPTSASTGAFGGIISNSVLAAGGSGYVANDTGIISAGSFNATYTVNTVTGGAVTTYTINAGGSGYVVGNNVGTQRGGGQPGTGTGFTINITGISGKANVSISLTASTDTQVNQIRVYRSTDSVAAGISSGTFFELPTSPYSNTTQNVTDNAVDTSLNIFSLAPFPGFNDPPTPGQPVSYFSGRMWLFNNNQVVFSGLEETIAGVTEEAFPSGPAGNFWKFDQPVQGLAVAGTGLSQTLAVFCGGRLYGIVGSSLDTFRRFLVTNRRGCRNLNTITTLGGAIAWFDSSQTVWMTDGQSLQEISLDIPPDLAGLSPTGANFTFHVSGRFHWLICAFPTKIFVYDLDLSQWLPPWSVNNNTVFSGETSAGVYELMLSTGTKALKMNQTGIVGSFNDNGNTYSPVVRTNNHAVVPDFGKRFSYNSMGLYDQPSRTGTGWYIQSDTNSLVTFGDVGILVDDDPLNANSAYTSIVTNKITPHVA